MTVSWTLNGLRMNGPSTGNDWRGTVSGIGAAGVRYASDGRVQADGVWSTTSYLESVSMGLEGTVKFRDPAEVPALINALDAAVAVHRVPLTMHWPSGDVTRLIKRDGEVVFSPVSDRIATWSCTVVADDPHWYRGGPPPVGESVPAWPLLQAQTGLPVTAGGMSFPFSFPFAFEGSYSSGDLQVSTAAGGWWRWTINAGSGLVSPRVTVTAADGSVRVLAWDGLSLAAGEFLQVDPQGRQALLQGQSPRVPSVRQWPVLSAGPVLVQFRAASGTDATLVVEYVPYG